MTRKLLTSREKLDVSAPGRPVGGQHYIAPEMQCVELRTDAGILTVSGDYNDVPWED